MRSRWDESFAALVVHFTHRFFDTDSPSEESVPRNRLIQFLALIFVVTPMLMVFVVRGEQSIQVQLGTFEFAWWWTGIHYTLVCYEMAVMGLVMTLKWDSLFPDRLDYLILTSLPVSTKRLFLAKAVAVGVILLLFALAANAVLIVFVAFMEPRAFLGHLVAVLGGSIFAVLFFLALQGILINLLPASVFRRVSPALQMVAIALLITLVLVLPLVAVSLRPLVIIDSTWLDYFPPVWFLGIYELLAPSNTPIPKLTMWAGRAMAMTALTALFVVISYGFGYRRHSRRVLESVDAADRSPRFWNQAGNRALHFVLGTNAFQRAAFDFLGKISDRSPKHRISAALYAGLGIALALSSLFVIDRREAFPIRLSAAGLLEAPAVLSFLLVAGWRSTFGIPYELGANWVFQMTSRRGAADFRKAMRKWLFVCRVLPLYVLVACFEFAWFDLGIAVSHLAFDLITTAFLIEALFFGFRKVPFTCAFLQSKLQLGVYAIGYLFAYTTYTSLMGGLKRWVSADVQNLISFAAISTIVFGVVLIYRSVTGAERSKFIYDDREPVYQQLDLS
jgi:hypothetical protein